MAGDGDAMALSAASSGVPRSPITVFVAWGKLQDDVSGERSLEALPPLCWERWRAEYRYCFKDGVVEEDIFCATMAICSHEGAARVERPRDVEAPVDAGFDRR